MMRYHRVSPDYLPVSNGRKPTTTLRTFKEDDPDHRFPNYSSPSSFDPKALRFRSTTSNTSQETTHIPHQHPSTDTPTPPAPKSQPHPEIVNGGGDVLLQWGHNKRSRGSRAERRAAAAVDESSGHTRQMVKIQRRGGALSPASLLPPCGSYSRGANLRPCMPSREPSSTLVSRSLDERSGGLGEHPRSEKRCPRSPPQQKPLKMGSCGATANGCSAGNSDAKPPSDQETGGGSAQPEKLNLDQFEWPRIYISLSRKEKEDDFLAMKGTKLPQRPKKRAKNVDKTLQYCFPGMWLSDLTRGRYEVREKKCVKKQKRRGLKGMESMESESE
ncbi:hypothetical protein J5N97_004465 [Dioscorea zingiberensis]|uniref:DUF1639 family protein n=1 Tax=Dioscorea zingiberensis TaxID=325984 RepID=A0A9D5D7Y0_9LILI|nr:hypothetical protein J5N97_004465 [Dioscorea zingiberensis]